MDPMMEYTRRNEAMEISLKRKWVDESEEDRMEETKKNKEQQRAKKKKITRTGFEKQVVIDLKNSP